MKLACDHFPGRSFELGTICNALACRGIQAPHTGKPYSEALLLGVSGGIAFAYMVFQYKGAPPHLALLTQNTFDPFKTALDRLGVVQETKETTDADRGLKNLIEAIENGSPAVVSADIFSLPYTNLRAEQMWQMMPVLVHAYDGISFSIADRSRVPLKLTVEELTTARGRVKKDRYRVVTLSPPDPKKLPAAVEAGIRHSIRLFHGEGVPKGYGDNFGFSGMQKLAHMLENKRNKQSWARVFSTGCHLYQALAGRQGQPGIFVWVMTWGAAPDALRGMYADFLDEASDILKQPKLRSVAAQFRAAQKLWRKLAETVLPADVPVLKESAELVTRQRQLFIEKGQAATEERREISARLAETAKAAADVLEPSGELASRILSGLRECVLEIEKAERESVAALQTLFR